MRKISILVLLLIISIVCADDFEQTMSIRDNGGGMSSSKKYTNAASIGIQTVGFASSDKYQHFGGFIQTDTEETQKPIAKNKSTIETIKSQSPIEGYQKVKFAPKIKADEKSDEISKEEKQTSDYDKLFNSNNLQEKDNLNKTLE